MSSARLVRNATRADLRRIREIYNEGIEDRTATLDVEPKSAASLETWFAEHDARFEVLVAEEVGLVVGWASLNRYSYRYAYDGVADLTIYVARVARGTGVGTELLTTIEQRARAHGFHKIVLFTLPFNVAGQSLYRKRGFREVGVFREQGVRDGHRIDVMAMEKIIA